MRRDRHGGGPSRRVRRLQPVRRAADWRRPPAADAEPRGGRHVRLQRYTGRAVGGAGPGGVRGPRQLRHGESPGPCQPRAQRGRVRGLPRVPLRLPSAPPLAAPRACAPLRRGRVGGDGVARGDPVSVSHHGQPPLLSREQPPHVHPLLRGAARRHRAAPRHLPHHAERHAAEPGALHPRGVHTEAFRLPLDAATLRRDAGVQLVAVDAAVLRYGSSERGHPRRALRPRLRVGARRAVGVRGPSAPTCSSWPCSPWLSS